MRKKVLCFVFAAALLLMALPTIADYSIAPRSYSAGTLYKKYTFYQTTTPAKRWTKMEDTLNSGGASNYKIEVTNGSIVLYTQYRDDRTSPIEYSWPVQNSYTKKIVLTVYNAYNGQYNMPISGSFTAYYDYSY